VPERGAWCFIMTCWGPLLDTHNMFW